MNEKKTIKQFSELSEAAKTKASDFISFLHKKCKLENTKSAGKNNKLKYYGIFKDNDAMKDSKVRIEIPSF